MFLITYFILLIVVKFYRKNNYYSIMYIPDIVVEIALRGSKLFGEGLREGVSVTTPVLCRLSAFTPVPFLTVKTLVDKT